jgi:lysophospholipase L1-like esterase
MPRKALKLGLFVLVNIIVVLVAIEIIFRLAAPTPVEPAGWFWKTPDPITGWSLQPGASGRSYDENYEYDSRVEINSLGLRSPAAIGYDKPAGVYRILVLGDSFVEAMQVEMQDAFHQQLGQILNQRGLRAEVIAAGVQGWGTDQELLWLREQGRRYRPDLVVLAFYPRNDFMNNFRPLEAANMGANLKPFFHLQDGRLVLEDFPFDPAQAPPPPSENTVVSAERSAPIPPGRLTGLGDWLHRHSAFYRWANPRLRLAAPRLAARLARTGIIRPGKETTLIAQGPDYVPLVFGVYQAPVAPAWQSAFDLTAALLMEIQAEARGMGAGFAVVLANSQEEIYAGEWQRIEARYPRMQGKDWSVEQPRREALRILVGAGIPTLDLVPVFLAADGARLHFPINGHWNEAGHRLAAETLAGFLYEQGLLAQGQ